MKIDHLEIDKETAEREVQAYKEIMKHKNDKWIKQTATMYRFLKEGKKIIDLYQIFKKIGLKNDLPKLAVCRADVNGVIFKKSFVNGKGRFGMKVSTNWGWKFKGFLSCPANTFNFRIRTDSKNNMYGAMPPIIPAQFIPQDSLSNYYVLWEVEKWNKIEEPPRPDPYLLKRITENLFVVLASWELTDLEKRIIRRK